MRQLSRKDNLMGSFLLLVAAFFWGTTFVAQTSAAEHVKTFTFNMSRNVVGSVFLLCVILIRDLYTKKKMQTDSMNPEMSMQKKWPLVPGIVCGIVLFFAMNTQQFGIRLYPEEAAASGRSGFLTATYVIMVAVIAFVFGRKKPSIWVVISIIGTIVGMYLLCMAGGFAGVYLGDVVELICAFCFALHIIVVDKFSDVDGIKLSCTQFIVCGAISAVLSLVIEHPAWQDIVAAAGPIFYAGILSSGVAYTLQIIGQKYAEPAVASIVMSLESVFAVFAGVVVLHESMSGRESLGCVLVFASVILAQIPGFKKEKQTES